MFSSPVIFIRFVCWLELLLLLVDYVNEVCCHLLVELYCLQWYSIKYMYYIKLGAGCVCLFIFVEGCYELYEWCISCSVCIS